MKEGDLEKNRQSKDMNKREREREIQPTRHRVHIFGRSLRRRSLDGWRAASLRCQVPPSIISGARSAFLALVKLIHYLNYLPF